MRCPEPIDVECSPLRLTSVMENVFVAASVVSLVLLSKPLDNHEIPRAKGVALVWRNQGINVLIGRKIVAIQAFLHQFKCWLSSNALS